MQDKFKKIERKRIIAMITFLIGIALLIVLFFLYLYLQNFIYVIPIILAFLVVFFFFYKFKKDYVKYYKQNFVAACINDLFNNTHYYPDKCIASSVIKEAHMVKMGNIYTGDDYLTGEYRGIVFTQSDITIQQKTKTSKSNSVSTYFKGKWIFFDFNKNFKESVIIRERKGSAVMAGNAGEKIEFESAEFNKEFRVYSNDQHTAFYLITPQFLVSLRKLRDNTKGQLLLGFVSGKLHIAINSGKNALEPKIFKKITENYIDSIRAEMKVITDFIDELIADKPNYKISDSSDNEYINIDVNSEPLFKEFK